jgi:signal peptidase I
MVAAAVGAVVLGAGAGVGLWVRHRLVLVTVVGSSMEPTLFSGDRVLVHRRGLARVRRGQIVVLEPPLPDGARHAGTGPALLADRLWNIKRVVALPGDPVPPGVPAVGAAPRVPRAALVVLGDNPASMDSRQRGFYPAADLLGVMVRRVSAAAGRRKAAPSADGAKRKEPS